MLSDGLLTSPFDFGNLHSLTPHSEQIIGALKIDHSSGRETERNRGTLPCLSCAEKGKFTPAPSLQRTKLHITRMKC
jgi:hypothetical protein